MNRAEEFRIVGIKRIAIVLLAGIAIAMIPGNLVSGQVFGIGMQQTGSIGVASVPYQTTISIDNRQAGVTPAVLNGISTGTHTVLLASPGYLPYSQQVTVSAGAVARVYAVLIRDQAAVPVSGSIHIVSTPSFASVWLDNRLTGVTPETIAGVTPGLHQLKISKPGYLGTTRNISVTGHQITEITLVLPVNSQVYR
ncbi:MAG TPA: PEGA domain-containing protein [Methanoregulaceae archaeon]|nr:PEGA domain-containing protein [Methanoregulaceae archaeon]